MKVLSILSFSILFLANTNAVWARESVSDFFWEASLVEALDVRTEFRTFVWTDNGSIYRCAGATISTSLTIFSA
ncbi:hypothetical protein C7B76_00960 [filamentous cyanobacterium CCP2]|nr:hypothetical protein C7B76_00960 [filamentous cyanobacterium CCP2]